MLNNAYRKLKRNTICIEVIANPLFILQGQEQRCVKAEKFSGWIRVAIDPRTNWQNH